MSLLHRKSFNTQLFCLVALVLTILIGSTFWRGSSAAGSKLHAISDSGGNTFKVRTRPGGVRATSLNPVTPTSIVDPFYTSGTLDGSDYGIRYFGGESTSLGGFWQGCSGTPFTGNRYDCIRRFNYATFTLPSSTALNSVHVWLGGFNNWGTRFVPSLKAEIYLGDLTVSANAASLIAASEPTLVDNFYPTGTECTFNFATPVTLYGQAPYTLRVYIPSGTFGDLGAGAAFALYGAYTDAAAPALAYAGDPATPSEYNGDVRDLPRVPLKPQIEVELEAPPSVRGPQASPTAIAPAPKNVELGPMPSPIRSFDGQSSDDHCGLLCGPFRINPSDVNGDVGRNHYVQAVNDSWAVYSKAGTPIASFTEDALWDAAQPKTNAPCFGNNKGDPVVIYDQFSDRWILTNFAYPSNSPSLGPFYQCIAVSKTSDPVVGGYWLYAVRMDPGGTGRPPNGVLNDYPKFGNWNDGCLYMSANEYLRKADTLKDPDFIGTLFASLNKSDLESGAPLTWAVGFIHDSNIHPAPNTMLPSNISGALDAESLPPSDTPNYFVSQSRTKSAFEVRKFKPGARCGVGGTLGDLADVSQDAYVAPDDGGTSGGRNNIIPQRATTILLDSLGDRLMNRAQYRRVGARESLWMTHTVRTGGDGSATGPQWTELDVSGGVIAPAPLQQQKYALDSTKYRWIGSIAADHAGNAALGYSVSSSTTFPGIAYSGRLVNDPENNLSRTEVQLISGNGSQVNCGDEHCSRWGDYTSMSVDPVDDCTFWYTNQYYSSQEKGDGGRWQTRIGSFRFPTCFRGSPVAQSDATAVENTPRGNPTQTLGPSLSGPFSSLEVKYEGSCLPNSQHFYSMILMEFSDSTYSFATMTNFAFPATAKVSSGCGTQTDVWAASDFGSTFTFDPSKFYAFTLYQLDARPRGSEQDVYPQGCYDTRQEQTPTLTCQQPTNLKDLYFVLTLNPPTPSADLSITKTASVNPAEVGRIFTYNITATNAGPSAATNVVVTDALPTGVTFYSAAPSQGSCVLASGTLTCQFGSLAANASANVALQVKPRQTGMLGNTASVAAAEPDPDTSDNSATLNVNVIKTADLKVSKSDSPDPVFVGEQVTYTMLVTNLGPLNTATGVALTDMLPHSMTFVSATTSQGSLVTPPVGSTGVITANIGSLAVNAQATVTVTVKAAKAGVVNNTATVSSNETDTNTSNNTATQTTTVKEASLQKVLLTKQVLTGGCENTTGNVYLMGPAAPGGVTVPLSSNISGASVPASVFIPAGQTVSPAFNVTTNPVVAKQVGLITAGNGPGTASRGLTINVGSGSCP
jgi:uncharacterized repeat protein (TIGR01451 family)